MIEQPKQRLLFPTKLAIEGPCQNSLSAHQQSQVGVHAASVRRSIVSASTRGEFVEPDGSGQIAFGHHGAKGAADRISRVKALCTERDIRFVRGEIVEAT